MRDRRITRPMALAAALAALLGLGGTPARAEDERGATPPPVKEESPDEDAEDEDEDEDGAGTLVDNLGGEPEQRKKVEAALAAAALGLGGGAGAPKADEPGTLLQVFRPVPDVAVGQVSQGAGQEGAQALRAAGLLRAGALARGATPPAAAALPAAATCLVQSETGFGSCMRAQAPDIGASLVASGYGALLVAAGVGGVAASVFSALPLSLFLIAKNNPEAFAGRGAEAALDVDPKNFEGFSLRQAAGGVLRLLPQAPEGAQGP